MHDTIWARSTVEELLSRQFVRPRPCNVHSSKRKTSGAIDRKRPEDAGLFRPGLRVVAIDGLQIDRWLDDPVVVTIEG